MRRQKAALATAKILPGKVYAIKHPDTERLVRFTVTKTITERIAADGSPNDYQSYVVGQVAENGKREELRLKANQILGGYEEHVELVEREKQEKQARKEKEAAIQKQVLDLWQLLYAVTGLPTPNDPKSYGIPFRLGYTHELEIKREGIAALTKAL